ncbi:GALC-like protein [Mya arenaria]|uniref:galactosylceramidase n=1 Tax=Mya arenaria TaxID=6604 RepID=A0ABY7FLV1_MYAAR|nr:GALC-like protein [Mya arenaria]
MVKESLERQLGDPVRRPLIAKEMTPSTTPFRSVVRPNFGASLQILKRNPDIKIYGLPWAFPGWLNKKGQSNPYTYPDVTAGYIISWIKGASKYYNITVDYVGIWNEKYYDKNYIKLPLPRNTHIRGSVTDRQAPVVFRRLQY